MEEKKKSGKGLVILTIILILALCGSVYYIYEIKQENNELENGVIYAAEAIRKINEQPIEENNNITKKDFTEDLEDFYGTSNMGKYFDLGYEMEHVNNNGGEDEFEASYSALYYYTGDHKGELWINDKKVEIKSAIKDFSLATTFSGIEHDVTINDGKKYEYTTKLYMLFEDGTIGKIDTNDLKKKDYSIKILSDYKNIDKLIEVEPLDSGMDTFLWCIDKEGNAYKIDTVVAGG